KGGVGKTTCAVSIALQLARAQQDKQFTILSVDPAHTLPRVFENEKPPANLHVEAIDTTSQWRALRDRVQDQLRSAIDALTPGGLTVSYDKEAIEKLIEIAPPGADEIFAVMRLAELIDDPKQHGIIVDTAPTGHFLRLLDLPKTAGDWVHEFMRLLLRYREIMPPGTLGEELVAASRALRTVDDALRSKDCAAIVVMRPERVVVAETTRLIDELSRRGIAIGAIIANYITPNTDDSCDQSMRHYELESLAALGQTVQIERRPAPVTALDDLARLVPVAHSTRG
ncbi:MAG TPA: ArsA family ATPase, partial [Thermoanaerobaculia bacterium]|nr:ArsA family ATPase [Thermoanaerobaculia bacterium]